MGLFSTPISSVTGRGAHLFSDETTVLLNGAGVRGIQTNDGIYSSFYYCLNLLDDAAGQVRIEAPRYVSTISILAGTDYVTSILQLNYYVDPTADGSTETFKVRSDSIVLGYDFTGGAILYIRQGEKIERYLVLETIAEILAATVTTTTTTTFPGGISLVSAQIVNPNPGVLRLRFDDSIDSGSISGSGSIANTITVTVNGSPIDMSGSTFWVAGDRVSMYLGDPAYEVDPDDIIHVTYDHDGGGGMGWNNGSGDYVEDFDTNVTNNYTTTSTTSSSTSSTSSTSTTSTSSTSSTSTETTTTSTSSSSSTSTSTTSTTTPVWDEAMYWDDGTTYFRLTVRNGLLSLDQRITASPGWDGVEDTDWGNIWQMGGEMTTTSTTSTSTSSTSSSSSTSTSTSSTSSTSTSTTSTTSTTTSA